MSILDALGLLPLPVQVAIASVVLGAAAVFGLETRYVSASDFQKSYVLQLKEAIRDVRKDIRDAETDEAREILEEDLAEFIDELCLALPDDRECRE